MRLSVKRCLTGVLVAGVLAFSAVGADANGGGNGPDAFIGIINGGLEPYNYSSQGPYTYSFQGGGSQGAQGGGFQANTGHQFRHARRHGQGGYGGHGYEGGYYSGY